MNDSFRTPSAFSVRTGVLARYNYTSGAPVSNINGIRMVPRFLPPAVVQQQVMLSMHSDLATMCLWENPLQALTCTLSYTQSAHRPHPFHT